MPDVKLGVTDRTVAVFIPDPASTDGSGKTGLVAANLTVSYTRVETDNDVVVTDVTSSLNNLSALTDAHNDWGLKEVSNTLAPGLYRLDIADAVFASGAWYAVVYVMVTTSAAAASPILFTLVAFDPLDTVRLGLTALPNAAADAAGGLVISDAGGLDADAQRADVAAILVDTNEIGTAGAGLTNINLPNQTMDIIGSITGSLSGSVGSVTGAVGSVTGAVGSVTGNVGGNVTGSVGSVVGAVGSVTGNVGGNVTGSVGSIATGGIAAVSFAAGAIDASAIAADAIGSSELAASAVTEIQSGLSTLTAADIRTAVGLASANLDTQLDALPTNTDLATALGTADDAVLAAIAALTIPTATQNADALLARDLGSGSGAGTLDERTVRSALRFNRNKFTIAGGTLTVYKEDDSTVAFTAAITQTAGDPVSASDPT